MARNIVDKNRIGNEKSFVLCYIFYLILLEPVYLKNPKALNFKNLCDLLQ